MNGNGTGATFEAVEVAGDAFTERVAELALIVVTKADDIRVSLP
jgi:hypothetical protein